ncbi:MAG: hypothetical protein WD033_06155 [Nitrosopumilaceae archaeon]
MNEVLGDIKTHIFNNKVIVAIDSRWLDFFNSKEPIFKAVIRDGKYVLIGPKVSTKDPIEPHNQPGEAVVIEQ